MKTKLKKNKQDKMLLIYLKETRNGKQTSMRVLHLHSKIFRDEKDQKRENS